MPVEPSHKFGSVCRMGPFSLSGRMLPPAHFRGLPIAPPTFTDGKSVEIEETAMDAGVFIETSFTPSPQSEVEHVPVRASTFITRRKFPLLTSALLRTLYLAIMRPQFGYAVQASTTYLQMGIMLMQRIATRCVKCF